MVNSQVSSNESARALAVCEDTFIELVLFYKVALFGGWTSPVSVKKMAVGRSQSTQVTK